MVAILCWPALDAIAQPTSGVQGRAERERAKLSFSLCVLCSRGFAAREPPGNLIPLIFSSFFFRQLQHGPFFPPQIVADQTKYKVSLLLFSSFFFYSKIVDVIHVNINSLSLHNARTLLQLRPRSRKETTRSRRRRNGNTQAQMEGR